MLPEAPMHRPPGSYVRSHHAAPAGADPIPPVAPDAYVAELARRDRRASRMWACLTVTWGLALAGLLVWGLL